MYFHGSPGMGRDSSLIMLTWLSANTLQDREQRAGLVARRADERGLGGLAVLDRLAADDDKAGEVAGIVFDALGDDGQAVDVRRRSGWRWRRPRRLRRCSPVRPRRPCRSRPRCSQLCWERNWRHCSNPWGWESTRRMSDSSVPGLASRFCMMRIFTSPMMRRSYSRSRS